jgi:hypothetical protein
MVRSPADVMRFTLAAALLAACAPAPPPPVGMPFFVVPEHAPVIDAFARHLPPELDGGARPAADPVAALAASTEGTLRVALVVEPSRCAGCYRIERATGGFVVRGDAPLGIQYGLAHLFEAMGVRFFHPHHTFVPAALAEPDPTVLDRDHAPEIAERGLHLHVLHPIEAYFDFWSPSPENLADAERTLHWIVANRGNYVTWTGLDDVVTGLVARERWTAHTRAILDAAHLRGVRVGLGVQLFGGANLQHAFDLVEAGQDPAAAVPARLDLIASLPFDAIQLSFGEFSGEEPARFVAALDLAYDEIEERWPGADVTGTVHVGNHPSTLVTYMGETQLYYFLVRYAQRPIVPWIHTVMYYDLFEDAGGAYGHDEFDAHRDYLLARIAAGEEVGYHPETAYWIAFDDSIPAYLPLYVRSRWLDLHEIRARSPAGRGLERHVVFSSGWEWGYWQNDWAVLRTSWALPPRWEDVFADMFAPLPRGPEVAAIVIALTEVQHGALIVERLAAYLASTDATFELGIAMGFWSQPRRPSFAEVMAMDPAARATFRTGVVDRLAALADATRAQRDALAGLGVDDPVVGEIEDGLDADLARTEFAAAIWGAAVAAGEGMPTAALLAEADAAMERARAVVARRHAAMHDPDPQALVVRRRNATLYQFGYLHHADTLCFYERERAEVRNAILGETSEVRGCAL